jgi:hypothetical protein
MLLPLRWLLYGTAAQGTTSGTRRNRKIQRKLRRLVQWSEVELPFVPTPQPKAEAAGKAAFDMDDDFGHC